MPLDERRRQAEGGDVLLPMAEGLQRCANLAGELCLNVTAGSESTVAVKGIDLVGDFDIEHAVGANEANDDWRTGQRMVVGVRDEGMQQCFEGGS